MIDEELGLALMDNLFTVGGPVAVRERIREKNTMEKKIAQVKERLLFNTEKKKEKKKSEQSAYGYICYRG